jgi:hypothetical protein
MIKPRELSTELSTEQIARRAHELYVQHGGEHGKDVEDWVRAEKELGDVPVAGPARTRPAPRSNGLSR